MSPSGKGEPLRRTKTDDRHDARAAARMRSQRGFTLLEALIAMSMFIVVLLAVFASAEFATKDSNNETERNLALSETTTGAARLVAELRRAYRILYPEGSTNATSDEIDFWEHIPEVGARQVLIRCNYKPSGSSYDECVRYQFPTATLFTPGAAPSGIPAEVMVQRVLNETSSDPRDPVFQALSYPEEAEFPTYGELVIHTPGKGGLTTSNYSHQVEIRNSFFIRNLEFGKT